MLFQRTLGMLDHTQLKRHDNTVTSMQQINEIAQPFPEISALCYFGECWACPGMSDQTQQILHELTEDELTKPKNELYLKILQSDWRRAFWPIT